MGALSAVQRFSALFSSRRHGDDDLKQTHTEEPAAVVPDTQTVLLLHGPRQRYRLTEPYPVPILTRHNEVLLKTKFIGLNPIDWKAPDYNFGIPQVPYISGRELSGDVVQVNESTKWKIGDRVIAISTDYRDMRKATYQEYVAALDYNLVRLPPNISYEAGSALGVAFVAAAMALGVSLGLDFSGIHGGPDLYNVIRNVGPAALPVDVRGECLDGIKSHERPRAGDWLAIWGGSATSANLVVQLAKLAGLKVAIVVDASKHALRLSNHDTIRPDLLVDSYDPERAVRVLRSNIKGKLRFGLDTRGKETAAHLLVALQSSTQASPSALPSPPGTPDSHSTARSHLVGLTGLPRGPRPEGTAFHTVPIKLFHEVPAVGEALAAWLGRLLEAGAVAPPEILGVEAGLDSINLALDRMRRGEISGGKLIVRV